MQFIRIESALNACEKHIASLDETDIASKEIETYLVGGLVVLIVSEFEELLERAFYRRSERCRDAQMANFAKVNIAQKFRSPDLKKINETLKRFDEKYKEEFLSDIENSQSHAAWDSIMKARHAVVHKQGALNITFRELKESFHEAKKVIEKVEVALAKKYRRKRA